MLVLPRFVHVLMLNSIRTLMEKGMEIRLVGEANEVVGKLFPVLQPPHVHVGVVC